MTGLPRGRHTYTEGHNAAAGYGASCVLFSTTRAQTCAPLVHQNAGLSKTPPFLEFTQLPADRLLLDNAAATYKALRTRNGLWSTLFSPMVRRPYWRAGGLLVAGDAAATRRPWRRGVVPPWLRPSLLPRLCIEMLQQQVLLAR